MTEVSEKSRGVALALAVPLGVLGVHRFYVGKLGTGLLMLLTGGGAGIWWIVDVANVASGAFRDRFGCRVSEWGIEPPDARLSGPELDLELEALNEDLDDVTERLELAERRLASRE
jgi:hypothetical protein